MKKILICFLIILALSSILAACADNKFENINYDFAVVTTTTTKEQSFISYYNKNGELVKKQSLGMAWLGETFGSDGDSGNYVYLGVQNKNGDAVQINRNTGEYNFIKMDFNLLTVNTDGENVYASDSSTVKSDVMSYNINSKQLKNKLLPKTLVESVYPYKDMLYVSVINQNQNDKDYNKQFLYVFDKNNLDLKLSVENNISAHIYYMYGYKNYLYIANACNPLPNDNTGSNILSEYDITNNKFNYYKLSDNYLDNILRYENNLLISHYNKPQTVGKNITIFNLDTKEQKLVTLQNDIYKATVKGDDLYTCDMDYMYIYSLKDYSLKNKINIKNTGYYITTIFTKPS